MLTEFDADQQAAPARPRTTWRTVAPALILVLNLAVLAYILFFMGRDHNPIQDVVLGEQPAGQNAADADVRSNFDPAADAAAGAATSAPDLSVADESLVSDSSYVAGVAAAVSRQMFPDGNADNVILARDMPSGDALAAGSLVGLFDTTMLLTDSQELTPVTEAELDRLGNPRIHILGGTDAVSLGIEQQLVGAGHDVHRHAGPLQAHTAVDIAGAHFTDARTAVLVRTPDRTSGPVGAVASALVATSLAASQDLPVLMTDSDRLSDATETYLEDSLIRQVTVVGNEEDMSSAVTDRLQELGIDWIRWGGHDRFETAVEVARSRGFESPDLADVVVLVEGAHDSVWPAGLLGTIQASNENGPVLLTQGDELSAATADYLSTATPGSLDVVCTPGVSPQACDSASEIVRG